MTSVMRRREVQPASAVLSSVIQHSHRTGLSRQRLVARRDYSAVCHSPGQPAICRLFTDHVQLHTADCVTVRRPTLICPRDDAYHGCGMGGTGGE